MSWWKKLGGKEWVNKQVGKLIEKARPVILEVLKKHLVPVDAEKVTDELMGELQKLKDKIW